MDLLSPDDLSDFFSSPFFITYWPIMVGGLVILIFLIRGYTRTTLPLAAIAIAVQAWNMGLFGEK